MDEAERQQQHHKRDKQTADARILGQIMAAQNILFSLPDIIRIAEFCAQIMVSIPGISACRVCLGGESVPAGGLANSVCAACETLRHLAWEDNIPLSAASGFKCSYSDRPGMRVIPVDSFQHRLGGYG